MNCCTAVGRVPVGPAATMSRCGCAARAGAPRRRSASRRHCSPTGGTHLLLLEHPHVFTHGPRADLRQERSRRAGCCRAEAGRGESWRRRDVPWPGSSSLPDPQPGSQVRQGASGLADSVCIRAIGRATDHRHPRRALGCERGRLAVPGVWIDADGENRARSAPSGAPHQRPHDARVRVNVATDMAYLRGTSCRAGFLIGRVTLARRGGHRGLDATGRRVVGRSPPRDGAADEIDRQDVAWKHRPDDLSAFSRRRCSVRCGPPRTTGWSSAAVRMLGRLEQAGVTERLDDLDAQARVASAQGAARHRGARSAQHLPRAQTRDASAKKRVARTCRNVGPTARPPSWCSASDARVRGFCFVDTGSPSRPRPTKRIGSPRPSPVWVWSMRSSRWSPRRSGRRRCRCHCRGDRHGAVAVAATRIEVLVSDFAGVASSIDTVIAARPDVYNHNLETVARLQRAVRPSAGYARSLAGCRGQARRTTVKSGLIVGMGETDDELSRRARRPRRHRLRHRHHRPVPPADHEPPAGASLGDPRDLRGVQGLRRVARYRPRRGQPADPLELPPQHAADRALPGPVVFG